MTYAAARLAPSSVRSLPVPCYGREVAQPDSSLMETKPAPKLDDEARAFVVQALACFETPSAVVAAVKAEFGAEISAQAVEAYDPTKRAGRHLGERWRTMFEGKRATFLADIAAIGISHKAVRLRELDRLFHRASRLGNLALAAALLEQAAKEVGGAYTNRRELTGERGKPLSLAPPAVVVYPHPDARAAVREIKSAELH